MSFRENLKGIFTGKEKSIIKLKENVKSLKLE